MEGGRRWLGCGSRHPPSHRGSLRKACRGCGCGLPPALGPPPPPARLSNTLGLAEHPGALPAWTGGQRRERLVRVTGLLSAWALRQESQPSSGGFSLNRHNPAVLPPASRRLWFLLKKRSLCWESLKTTTDQGGRNLCGQCVRLESHCRSVSGARRPRTGRWPACWESTWEEASLFR